MHFNPEYTNQLSNPGGATEYLQGTTTAFDAYSIFVVLTPTVTIDTNSSYRNTSFTFVNVSDNSNGRNIIIGLGSWTGFINNELIYLSNWPADPWWGYGSTAFFSAHVGSQVGSQLIANERILLNFNYNSSTNKYDCYKNGVNQTGSNFQYWEESDANNPKLISMNTITLGALGPRHENGVQHFCNNIIVSEFIIYHTSVTANTITNTNDYLKYKWNIGSNSATTLSITPFIHFDSTDASKMTSGV